MPVHKFPLLTFIVSFVNSDHCLVHSTSSITILFAFLIFADIGNISNAGLPLRKIPNPAATILAPTGTSGPLVSSAI